MAETFYSVPPEVHARIVSQPPGPGGLNEPPLPAWVYTVDPADYPELFHREKGPQHGGTG